MRTLVLAEVLKLKLKSVVFSVCWLEVVGSRGRGLFAKKIPPPLKQPNKTRNKQQHNNKFIANLLLDLKSYRGARD